MPKLDLTTLGVLAVAAVVAAFVAAPFTVDEYQIDLLTVFLINIILAQSYRVVTQTGDWTLSHVAFMGVGSYATALLAKNLGWPFWATLPLSGVAAMAIGLAVAFPLLRTRGFGLFIASFALGEFIRLTWIKFQNPFGGPRGMIGIPMVEIGAIDFYVGINFYFLTLVVTLVSLVILYRIDRSRIGAAWKSIYMDAELAESVGINVSNFRLKAFAVSSFFAGIAGALLAHRLGAIDPHSFGIETMVYLVIWVVVGGTATFWGPLIGVGVMTVIFEMSRPLQEWRPALFGLILILFLILLPGGLESLFPRLTAMARARMGRSKETPDAVA
jgi:branched-chain amino acid transport system permease protein